MTVPFIAALSLHGRRCVVVGSGPEVALRVDGFREAGAEVIVVSERPTEHLKRLADDGSIELRARPFVEADLDGAWLATLADIDAPLGAEIAEAAASRRVFFCAVDQPELNGFSHVAVARAGALRMTVSTGGRAPALAKRLRQRLEAAFEEVEMETFVTRLAALRDETPPERRKAVLTDAVSRVELRLSVPKADPDDRP